jgi:sialidase-1
MKMMIQSNKQQQCSEHHCEVRSNLKAVVISKLQEWPITTSYKGMLKYVFCTLLIVNCGLIVAHQSFAQTVKQQQYRLPVLPQKAINPVLRLSIYNPGQQVQTLQSINLNIVDGIGELAQVQCLDGGQDSTQLTTAKLNKLKVLGSLALASKQQLQMPVKLSLQPGENYIWLAVKLKDKAKLGHLISIQTTSALIDRKEYTVEKVNDLKQRVAIALRQEGQENVKSHRIPGLETAKDGTLLAIYDARYDMARDLQGHIDIGLSRSLDKGQTWLPMQVVLDMGEWGGLPQKFNGVSDACILVDDKTGTIFIAGLWMYGVINSEGKWVEGLNEQSTDWNHQWKTKGSQPGFGVKQTAQFLITKSTDNGKTWSEPVNITKMGKKEEWWLWAPAPGHGITLADGTLVFPTQGRDKKGKPFSNITYSKDGGKTWHASKPALREQTTENMAVQLTNGDIMLNMRANANRNDTSANNGRAVATTKDLGNTWTEHVTSHKALPEPVCMASIHRHNYNEGGTKKSILIFCNPLSKTARNNITVQVSTDDGLTWQPKVLLDEWKGRGYSCLTSVDEETIGVLYESSQADLVFETIKLKDLIN